MSKQPPPAPTTSAVGPCPTVIQIVGRPGTGSLPSTIAPPDHSLLGSKVKLIGSLVISIFLYACESWTLTAELEKRTQAFEMRCNRRLLNISYKDHVTNEEVRRKIQAAIGEYDELLTLVKKRKLRWFGHVSRSSGLAKTILQGTVKGKRKRGR